MSAKQIDIFDTTLRDGTQGEKVSFSVEDKVRIAERLDQTGIRYIEGGWPGSNPKDLEFFKRAKDIEFDQAKLVAFGSTLKAGNHPDNDKNIQSLIEAETPVICVFGKSWILHVKEALNISEEKNLELIKETVTYLKKHNKEVVYDAEHFFDGYKADRDYAIQTLKMAEQAGADVIVLCDTNGGMLTNELAEVVEDVGNEINTKLGIHAHNDSELAVANTMTAVQKGCEHVQGTINGYGERCGNANLCSVIPNLQLKMGCRCIGDEHLKELKSLSHLVSERANLSHNHRLPYVGNSAFAHKGGVHVSAIMKNEATYEHTNPDLVGNSRRVLVSDLSGKSNINYKAKEQGIDLEQYGDKVPGIVEHIKELEKEGYQFEAAEASFELLVKRLTGEWESFFKLEGYRVNIEKEADQQPRSEATVRVNVNGQTVHSAAEGEGPVNALDCALRKGLNSFYPEISQMQLTDYKVRVMNEKDGTQANVRVLIDTENDKSNWSTIGVSTNIIEASWQALTDSISYYLTKHYLNTTNGANSESVGDEQVLHK